MKRWKVILAAALIFTTGVISGAVAHKLLTDRLHPARPAGLGPGLMDPRSDLLDHMRSELHLTAAQAQHIESVLKEGRSRMRQVWDTCQPQFKEEMKRIREDIQAVLDPAQRARFDELYKHSKNKDKKGEQDPPPGVKSRSEPPTSPDAP